MKPKTTKITYWTITIIFAAFMTMGAVQELMHTASADKVLTDLGYPVYLNNILGIAKIVGAIAIIQWKYKAIKEWAYSGFTIDILGAVASMYFVGTPIAMVLMTSVIFLGVLFTSYFLGKKVDKLNTPRVKFR